MKLSDIIHLDESFIARLFSGIGRLTRKVTNLGNSSCDLSLERVPARNISSVIDTVNKLTIHLGGKINSDDIDVVGSDIHFSRITFPDSYKRDYFLYIMGLGDRPIDR